MDDRDVGSSADSTHYRMGATELRAVGTAPGRGPLMRVAPANAALEFAYDLTLDEIRRRRGFLEAVGDTWDPIEAMVSEERAHRMLYSSLDDAQQRIFDELVRVGVLPDRPLDHAAD